MYSKVSKTRWLGIIWEPGVGEWNSWQQRGLEALTKPIWSLEPWLQSKRVSLDDPAELRSETKRWIGIEIGCRGNKPIETLLLVIHEWTRVASRWRRCCTFRPLSEHVFDHRARRTRNDHRVRDSEAIAAPVRERSTRTVYWCRDYPRTTGSMQFKDFGPHCIIRVCEYIMYPKSKSCTLCTSKTLNTISLFHKKWHKWLYHEQWLEAAHLQTASLDLRGRATTSSTPPCDRVCRAQRKCRSLLWSWACSAATPDRRCMFARSLAPAVSEDSQRQAWASAPRALRHTPASERTTRRWFTNRELDKLG